MLTSKVLVGIFCFQAFCSLPSLGHGSGEVGYLKSPQAPFLFQRCDSALAPINSRVSGGGVLPLVSFCLSFLIMLAPRPSGCGWEGEGFEIPRMDHWAFLHRYGD